MDETRIPQERDNLKAILEDQKRAKKLLEETLGKRKSEEYVIERLRKEESSLKVSIRELTGIKSTLEGETDNENKRLTKTREALEKLRLDKEEFIEKRREEANEALVGIQKKLDAEMEILLSVRDESKKLFNDTVSKVDRLFDQVLLTTGKAEKLFLQAENLKNIGENTMVELKKRSEELDKKTLEYSEADKFLKIREGSVKQLSEDASRRLKEARDLVFWHKKPGIYKE